MVEGWDQMCSAGVQVHLDPIVVVAVKTQYLKRQGGVSGRRWMLKRRRPRQFAVRNH